MRAAVARPAGGRDLRERDPARVEESEREPCAHKRGAVDRDGAGIIDTAGSKQVMPIRDYLASFADCSAQLRDAAKRGEPTPPMPYLRTWFFADQLPELVEEFETPPQVADDAFRRLPADEGVRRCAWARGTSCVGSRCSTRAWRGWCGRTSGARWGG